MFGLGMPEILIILAIALIVIGPKKLPDLAKTLGRAMGEFKRSAQDFKRSIDVETTVKDIKDIDVPEADLEGIIKDANFKDNDTSGTTEETDPAPYDTSQKDPDDVAEEPAPDKEPGKTDPADLNPHKTE